MEKEQQVKVLKSVEGGEFKEVIINRELFDSLFDWEQLSISETFLRSNDIITDDNIKSFNIISDNCQSIFRKYNLNKYDVRAVYKFDEAIKLW